MDINKMEVAKAISKINEEPFTCFEVIEALRNENYRDINRKQIEEILEQFTKKKWIERFNGSLYFRTFRNFSF